MSILHQHSHPTLKYCLNVIPPPGVELGSLVGEIGISTIRFRINESSKLLLKMQKLAFRIV